MAGGIGIETGGAGLVDLAHMLAISMIMAFAGIAGDVFLLVMMALQIGEHFFRRVTQINAQMIDQLELAVFVNLGKQRHFGISRPALYQSTTGIIAHPAEYGSADTRRTDYRMRLAPQRFEQLFQLV